MATVETRAIRKEFGDHTAVDGVDLQIREGEFLVLLGPSGCGKTTLLRMIAGLEKQTSGDVMIGGQVVNDLPPRARKIAMVFQSYALYPHLTVEKNIAFPLKAQGVPRASIPDAVRKAAAAVGIEKLLHRKPRQLSGGERQRVALARAMVRSPDVFLLDEPLSNLDAKLRMSARDELQQFQRRLGTTTIYVTHDQVEAMGLGDRIAVMNGGQVRQIGKPQEVYDEPADTFVAGFLGSPPMNFFERDGALVGFRPEQLLPQGELRDEGPAGRLLVPGRSRREPGRRPAALRLAARHRQRSEDHRQPALDGAAGGRDRAAPTSCRFAGTTSSSSTSRAACARRGRTWTGARDGGAREASDGGARPHRRQRGLARAPDAGAGDRLHLRAGGAAVRARRRLQLHERFDQLGARVVRRTGHVSPRGRGPCLSARARQHLPVRDDVAGPGADPRQHPGHDPAARFSRQMAGAPADPVAVGRAGVAGEHCLAVDVRFHLQRHQLDAALAGFQRRGRSGWASRTWP